MAAPTKPPANVPGNADDIDVKDRPATKEKTEQPRLYKVIFHNDDFTTMEFVLEVLRNFFKKSESEAFHIMITVHKKGAATAARFTRDIAETKTLEVTKYARKHGMPLLVTCEAD